MQQVELAFILFQGLFHPAQQIIDRLTAGLGIFRDFPQLKVIVKILFHDFLLFVREQPTVDVIKLTETDPFCKAFILHEYHRVLLYYKEKSLSRIFP